MLKSFEHRKEPLASTGDFLKRMLRFGALAIGIILVSLGIGIVGYHYLEGLSWIDSLLNASMILGGMGPVAPLQTTAGKLFASFYALFAGMVFLVAVGVLVAPIFHRFLHRFNLDMDEGGDN
jgi:hypothetical protein